MDLGNDAGAWSSVMWSGHRTDSGPFSRVILVNFVAISRDMVLESSLLYQTKYRQWGHSQDVSNRWVRSGEKRLSEGLKKGFGAYDRGKVPRLYPVSLS